MKYVILSLAFTIFFIAVKAQTITELPAGKYDTKTKQSPNSWDRGDIIIVDATHYKLSGSQDVGEYKFSVAAQRIFFTSGPLKSAFTKLTVANGKPVIILPIEQNGSLGITAEIWASKQ